MLKVVCTAILLSSTLFAQGGYNPPASTVATPPANVQPQATQPPQPSDDLDRMRLDLDHMEGLLGNMSSEIEFLHDQNLQILLRTNSQMWALLLRDMRQQLAREQQRQAAKPLREPDTSKPSPTPQKH